MPPVKSTIAATALIHAFRYEGRTPVLIRTAEYDVFAKPGDWVLADSQGGVWSGKANLPGLEVTAGCKECGCQIVVKETPSKLKRRLAGRRYRCAQCGVLGRPSLSMRRLAEHASKLEIDISKGVLLDRKIDRH